MIWLNGSDDFDTAWRRYERVQIVRLHYIIHRQLPMQYHLNALSGQIGLQSNASCRFLIVTPVKFDMSGLIYGIQRVICHFSVRYNLNGHQNE